MASDNSSRSSSVLTLIAVNMVPVFGVFFWGWEIFPIMFLFWSENVIIGFFNVLRMITCNPQEQASWAMKAFMIPFFIIHYGGFSAGHGVFVFALFGQGYFKNQAGPAGDAVRQFILDYNLHLAMLALFLSHGYSFIMNYLGKGEYKKYTFNKLMMQPYSRIVLLHITLIFGGFLMMALKSPVMGLLFFILLKIGMDLLAHLKEHRWDRKRFR